MKWTLLLTVLAAGAMAHGTEKIDPLAFSPADDSSAQLLINVGPSVKGHEMPESCKNVNLTSDQEDMLRDVVITSVKERIKIKAELRIAKLEYLHNISSEKSFSTEAETSGAQVSAGFGKLIANRIATTNTIIYSVLKPEQRRAATKCMLALRLKHKAHRLARMCKVLPTPDENEAELDDSAFPDAP